MSQLKREHPPASQNNPMFPDFTLWATDRNRSESESVRLLQTNSSENVWGQSSELRAFLCKAALKLVTDEKSLYCFVLTVSGLISAQTLSSHVLWESEMFFSEFFFTFYPNIKYWKRRHCPLIWNQQETGRSNRRSCVWAGNALTERRRAGSDEGRSDVWWHTSSHICMFLWVTNRHSKSWRWAELL